MILCEASSCDFHASQFSEWAPFWTRAPFLNKLNAKFVEVNGTNSYRIIKGKHFIRIKDGHRQVFHCGVETSFQRNLYLQFHSVDYHCDAWIEEYADFNCSEEARDCSELKGSTTPP